jgi:hypothetical protein
MSSGYLRKLGENAMGRVVVVRRRVGKLRLGRVLDISRNSRERESEGGGGEEESR